MAILKDIEQDNGVTVGYWVLTKLFFRVDTMRVEISYEGYIDKAAYVSHKSPVCTHDINIDANNTQLAAAVIGYGQGAITALPEFENAVTEVTAVKDEIVIENSR